MAVVATGFFDGVHLGHRLVLDKVIATAKSLGEEAVAVTFDRHPRAVLKQDARGLRLLTSLDEKKEILQSLPLDRVEVFSFTRDFAALTAEQYILKLKNELGATTLVVGHDNKIGCDGAAYPEIRKICGELGMNAVLCGQISSENGSMAVSSTKIRTALSGGDLQGANAMLGYEYFLTGVVVPGNRMGRTIGFPTANMRLYEPLKQIPANGVYLVEVLFPEGLLDEASRARNYYGMCNVGSRPTVASDGAISIETNIFDFDEDIYGLPLRIFFKRYLRAEKKFADLGELASQLNRDLQQCKMILKRNF